MKPTRFNLDALGMCASTLCMIHCLAFPLLLAAFPMWKLTAAEASRHVAGQLESAPPHDQKAAQLAAQCSDQQCCPTDSLGGTGEAEVSSVSCCSTPTDLWVHIGLLTNGDIL